MAKRRKGQYINGILLIDKPQGVSSNAALQSAKRIFDARKAGHTGSLDPLATGLLPVCFGEATKISGYLLEADKSYDAEICLGVTTKTGDSEGEVTARHTTKEVTETRIHEALSQFVGEIDQIPPMYSALKRNGQPLYKLARQGVEVKRVARRVRVTNIVLTSWSNPYLNITVSCSKGTYIRTLAEDIGRILGSGGHISALRRTKKRPIFY